MKKKKNQSAYHSITQKENLEKYLHKKQRNNFWDEMNGQTEEDSPIQFLIIAFILCIFSIGGWFVYHFYTQNSADVIPVVTPATQNYYAQSVEQGGIKVPHQEKMIFHPQKKQGSSIMESEYAENEDTGGACHIHCSCVEKSTREDRQQPIPQNNPYSVSSHTPPLPAKPYENYQNNPPRVSPPPPHPQEIKHTSSSAEPAVPKTSHSKPQKNKEKLIESVIDEDVFQVQFGSFKNAQIASRELARLKKRHSYLLRDYDFEFLHKKNAEVSVLIGPFYSRTQALSVAIKLGNRAQVIKERI